MAYNPANIPTSVVVSGCDIRAHFGAEVLSITGRDDIELDRRAYTPPLAHGVRSQGGRYKPMIVKIGGWMTKSNVARFRRFLFADGALPAYHSRQKALQFADDPNYVYIFDTALSFRTSPRSGRWSISGDVNWEAAFEILSAFPRHNAPGSTGLVSKKVTALTRTDVGSGVAQHLVIPGDDLLGCGVVNSGTIRATHFDNELAKMASAQFGFLCEFNGNLEAKKADTSDVVGVVHEPYNLVDNGSLRNTTVTAFAIIGAGGVMTRVSSMKLTDKTFLLPKTGTHMMKVKDNGAGDGGMSASFTAASGSDYIIRVEYYTEIDDDIDVIVEDAGSVPIRSYLSTGKIGWNYLSFVVSANASATWKVNVTAQTPSALFAVNRVQVILSGITNGAFETGVTGWTPTGTGSVSWDSTDWRNGVSGGNMKLTSDSGGYVSPPSMTTTTDKAMLVEGYVKFESGTGNMLVVGNSNVAIFGAVPNDGITGRWIRFSAIGKVISGTTGAPFRFTTDSGSTTVLHFADVAVTQLEPVDDQIYETGLHGLRLQVDAGSALEFEALENQRALTMVSHHKPLWNASASIETSIGNGWGNLLQVAFRDYQQALAMGFGNNKYYALHSSNDASAYAHTLVAGDNFRATVAAGNEEISPRGTQGVVVTLDDIGLRGGNDLKLFCERWSDSEYGGNPMGQAAETSSANVLHGTQSYSIVMIGDGIAIDAAWNMNYAASDEQAISAMVARDVPVHTNRLFSFTWVDIGDPGDTLFIDLARHTVEYFDFDKGLTGEFIFDGWPYVTGELPFFTGEHGVLLMLNEMGIEVNVDRDL